MHGQSLFAKIRHGRTSVILLDNHLHDCTSCFATTIHEACAPPDWMFVLQYYILRFQYNNFKVLYIWLSVLRSACFNAGAGIFWRWRRGADNQQSLTLLVDVIVYCFYISLFSPPFLMADVLHHWLTATIRLLFTVDIIIVAISYNNNDFCTDIWSLAFLCKSSWYNCIDCGDVTDQYNIILLINWLKTVFFHHCRVSNYHTGLAFRLTVSLWQLARF